MGICCVTQQLKAGALYQPRGVGWGGRWEGSSRGKDICMPMADSCWYLAEYCKVIILQLKIKSDKNTLIFRAVLHLQKNYETV